MDPGRRKAGRDYERAGRLCHPPACLILCAAPACAHPLQHQRLAAGEPMNPLDTIKGTLIAGFVLAIVLTFVIKALA